MSDCCNKCGSITLFKGTNGDYVQVTPEPAGGNCPEGGLKVEIISGVDDTTVKDTQYVCNGEQGLQGLQGLPGQDGQDGASGADGADGQGIDHISRTAGDGSPGTTDTYTVWGDVGETINLGTFTVYNGANGAGDTFLEVDFSSVIQAGASLPQLAHPGLVETCRPNHTYYITGASAAPILQTVNFALPDSLGSENGGFAPQPGDTVKVIGPPLATTLTIVLNTRGGSPVSVGIHQIPSGNHLGIVFPNGSYGYQEVIAGGTYNTISWDPTTNPTANKDSRHLYIECKYLGNEKWIVTDHTWFNSLDYWVDIL